MKNTTSNPQRKKRFPKLKIISIITCFLASLSILIGCFVDWSRPSWIFIAGSSTMQPLMENISNIYKSAEISVNAGGSSYGINSVLSDKKNIGTVSKMPSEKYGLPSMPSNPNSDQATWKQDQIKTVTISKGVIGIIYKAPSNVEVVINNDNIPYLYLAFAGHVNVGIDRLSPATTQATNLNIVPFARAGGSKESGTAESFLTSNRIGDRGSKSFLSSIKVDDINLDPNNTSSTGTNVWSALEHGEYGTNVIQTNETSLETWENIKGYSGNGIPMTYLSGSFIKNNLEEIERLGFRVAKYKTSDIDLVNSETNQFDERYNWFTPLNLVMKTNKEGLSEERKKTIQESQKFVQWILGNMMFEKSELKKIYDDISFTFLTPNNIKTMFGGDSKIIDDISSYATQNPNASYDDYLNDSNQNHNWENFWHSDYSLYEQQKIIRDETKEYYGAILTTSENF